MSPSKTAPGVQAALQAPAHALAFCALAAALVLSTPQADAQGGTSSPSTAVTSASSAVSSGQSQLYNATGQNGASVTNDSFKGSLIQGKNTGTVIDLSLDDAIRRGLRTNLGVILQGAAQQNANGQRLQELQALLPTIAGNVNVEVQQVNLAAYGLKFPGLNPIIGPFQTVDFRAYLTQNLFNLNALESYISAKHNFAAAKLTAEDARDMVTLTVGNAYLLCIADAARIAAVKAELQTSNVTLNQATASHDAGTSPRIDVLRAQVDVQNEQQSLISATNQLAKDRIALARTIGLPLDQQFNLSDTEPYKPLDGIDPEAAFQQALKTRKDLAAAEEQVKASEAQKKAAFDDRLPTASFSGDFGDLGETPGHSHGTYSATGQLAAPILQIVKDKGETEAADAQLQQARARYSDQLQQVNADIHDNILDIQAAAKLVDATRTNLALANEELSEAQQRFHAGVADNLPVSQAQSAVEQANDQYISALYQHNVAKLSLARALGVAQTNYQDYLGGK
jgi:outer membrane protein TolC